MEGSANELAGEGRGSEIMKSRRRHGMLPERRLPLPEGFQCGIIGGAFGDEGSRLASENGRTEAAAVPGCGDPRW